MTNPFRRFWQRDLDSMAAWIKHNAQARRDELDHNIELLTQRIAELEEAQEQFLARRESDKPKEAGPLVQGFKPLSQRKREFERSHQTRIPMPASKLVPTSAAKSKE